MAATGQNRGHEGSDLRSYRLGLYEPDFFPLIGGPLAIRANVGFGPVLLSLVMLQTYSIVLGTVYAALGRRSVKFFRISSQDDRRANY